MHLTQGVVHTLSKSACVKDPVPCIQSIVRYHDSIIRISPGNLACQGNSFSTADEYNVLPKENDEVDHHN